jgi:hypothetical protein
MRNEYTFLVGISERKRPLGRARRRWEILLERILRKQGGKMWTGRIWLRIGTNDRLL